MTDSEPRGPERPPRPARARDRRTGRDAAEQRIANQGSWVELQIQQAVQRGDFADLPGAGRPISDLGAEHDPDWWVKKLVEREQISVLPPALAIRREDAELDDQLDRVTTEEGVRQRVAEFNAAVRTALYTPPAGPMPGPPMITRPRDPDLEVERWRERRTARREAQRQALAALRAAQQPRSRRWWPGRRRRPEQA
ncbi:DUF1992 domain-containing protein [Nocardioides houyundeii]|uniref:DnaJ family domain-containing protein n=1 Tax=Nocardioides houyundeii TaxID=2045452 RepID=UPI000C78A3DF|nr:DUF1992 domain-containing protein [Nocardioides houyundeii]